MSNIRVDVGYAIHDGSELKFRSPVDCSAITGLIVYYPGEDGNLTSKVFVLADAHGNNVGNIDHLFAENVVVKVILDVTTGMAFVQNADTNAYLEGHIQNKANPHRVTASQIGAAPAGFGLGEYATAYADHADADYIYQTGWYNAEYDTPDNTRWIIEHVEDGSYRHQIAHKNGIICYRNYFSAGGYWDSWEYVNPPMEYGVEYRTTERYKGYPVYTVTLNLGYTRDSGYYRVSAPGVEIEYPNFTVIDISTVCLDGESTKEIGCYYDATLFFDYIAVQTSMSPLTVGAMRNEYFDYNGTIFKTIVTIKYVRVDLDSAYANA